MPKKISNIAVARIPSKDGRIALYLSKLRISLFATDTIKDYRHASLFTFLIGFAAQS